MFVNSELEQKRTEGGLRFLAEAGRLLANSLDYETTLRSVAQLAVPTLADWCAVDLISEDGTLQRLAVAHVDPTKVARAHEVATRYPSDSRSGAIFRVLQTGEPVLYADISDEMLVAGARDAAHLALLRELGFTSAIVMPLVARSRTLGTITLVHSDAKRHFEPDDIALGEELCLRAALAIDNARLYQAAEVARANAVQAQEHLQEFVGIVAHDLGNSLTPIQGYAQIIKRPNASPERIENSATAIEQHVVMMHEMLGYLVDAARIGAGKLEVRPESMDLAALARSRVEARQVTTQRHHLRLEAPARLDGTWDPERLTQALDNLLTNAIHYSPDGGEITVRLEEVDGDALLSVSDEGIGLRAEDIPRLFQLFTRLESSGAAKGTGLGLYITRGIVEAHGGTVRAESPGVGQGSAFHIRLPRNGEPS